MPLPVKLLMVPPITITSAAVKLVELSLNLNVTTAFCEAKILEALAVTVMVGGVVSSGGFTVNDTLLFESAPSELKIPSASENLPLPTLTDAPFEPSMPAVKVAV